MDLVEKAVVDERANALDFPVDQAEVDQHAGVLIGRTSQRDDCPVAMTMNPSTWISVDLAMQRMGSLEYERL
ncbi:UNVERIFIED_ORG: hypothetical protein ABIC54_000744 [Burkholderia sp. 1263]|uniref:Uncharacterized protein n=1 Tax=Paraburkholderia terricola TaxID=169427 RepID=A0ABU1M068_9BURK|nr:hypothetical protein [Paraburkholderia terricola]MDR6449955.1 hypothetical protein [Paraburkholderia terricola]MDR6484597.1 hypothetical protein [Paraburkholderia terricola]